MGVRERSILLWCVILRYLDSDPWDLVSDTWALGSDPWDLGSDPCLFGGVIHRLWAMINGIW